MEHNSVANQAPKSINIWLESLKSSAMAAREMPEAERLAVQQKDEAILMLLAKLAVVYWRPDFTAGQAKQLYTQYLDDLRPFAFKDIAAAIETYRQNPENKFYPLPGQLRGIIATPYSWDPSPRKHLPEKLADSRAEMDRMVSSLPAPRQLAAE